MTTKRNETAKPKPAPDAEHPALHPRQGVSIRPEFEPIDVRNNRMRDEASEVARRLRKIPR